MTTEQTNFYLQLLGDILAQPTAPYHEERVAGRVAAYLREWEIPFSVDNAGNLIARYQRGAACRPLILMAHMDHPAFTVTARGGPAGADLTGDLEGGVPAACFAQPVPVHLFTQSQKAGVRGRIVGHASGDRPRDVKLFIALDEPESVISPGDFGIWDLPDMERRDGLIHARAIDDLAGCVAALLTLWAAAREQCATDLYAVFTRAEEVGLVGADAVMRGGALPRDGYIVSLEASPERPGAIQGEGPVIRAGDRVVTFSHEAELILLAAAQRLGSTVWQPAPGLAAPAPIKVQRQLMSGGRCEGSGAIMQGYHATGLAFPLGNYHNVADGSVLAPEYIHEQDYLTGIALLQEAARLIPEIERVSAEYRAAYEPSAAQIERLRASAERIEAAVI